MTTYSLDPGARPLAWAGRVARAGLLAAAGLATLSQARPALASQVWGVNPTDPVAPVLAQAHPGDTVLIEGMHGESVRVPAGVTLEGGPGAGFEFPTEPVVQIRGSGVHLRGLVIMTTASSGSVGAIDVPVGDATVIGCSVRGGAIGVSVEGTARATLAACMLTGQSSDGIVLSGRSQSVVANCRVRPSPAQRKQQDGPEIGISATGDSLATIENDDILGTLGSAIQFAGSARGSVTASHLHDGFDGIALWGTAAPALVQNTIVGNLGDGISYHDRSAGRAQGNRCEHDRSGIVVADAATPALIENVCQTDRNVGIEDWRDQASASVPALGASVSSTPASQRPETPARQQSVAPAAGQPAATAAVEPLVPDSVPPSPGSFSGGVHGH